MSSPVVTRFAPSPTGFLHIGGARTALFNWLYAKKHHGKMLLRIEDTDRKRSTQEAIQAILNGLEWLGLQWDEEPVFQSKQSKRHQEIAHRLVEEGKAYYCYATPEQLQQMRDENANKHNNVRSSSYWRDKTSEDFPQDIAPAIRIKIPLEGDTLIKDKVQGDVKIPNNTIEDFVILRSDGSPTYMLSVVVDDHDMGVTHIIRGDDHLTNAAKQILLYKALNWDVPVMAHIPLIHGSDGAKLSKRHGALGVEAYRSMGYLPEALLNYLVRLGWSHKNEEIITQENMIKWFDLEHINKAPARLDFKKLDFINSHYMRAELEEKFFQDAINFLDHNEDYAPIKQQLTTQTCEQLKRAFPILRQRAKNFIELWQSAKFIFKKEVSSDNDRTLLENQQHLRNFCENIEKIQDWTKETLSQLIHDYLEQKQMKMKDLAQILRLALTGTSNTPGITDLLLILGPQESLKRIQENISSER